MKLIGSKAEEEFRRELLGSHDSILFGNHSMVGAFLKEKHPELKTAYVLNHIPEQSEDIFLVLINTDTLVRVEIDRHTVTTPPVHELLDLKQYKQKLSQIRQIQLAVALDLARKNET